MSKVTNVNGQTFEVTFDKVFRTSYGLPFKLFAFDDERIQPFKTEMNGFFNMMLVCHNANIGCCVFVINERANYKYELPIAPTDNEYDLDEIYSMVERGECV